MYMVVEIKKICFMSYADLLQVNDHSFDLPEISQRSFAEPRPCVCVFVCVCVCVNHLHLEPLAITQKKEKVIRGTPPMCMCVFVCAF